MAKFRLFFMAVAFLSANMMSSHLHAQNNFDKDRDILICQYDNFPDSDDIYAQAALATFLAHPDQEGVNYFCVAGAYGTQVYNAGFDYDDTEDLMNLGFGREAMRGDSASERAVSRWVTAHGEIIYGEVRNGVVTRSQERIDNMDFASDVIVEKVKPILEAGGRVFVTEAGQSDITADWIEKLVADGVPNTQSNVILVQHSSWNRRQTAGNSRIYDDGKDDWGYVTNGEVNTFISIDDGNSANNTPNYKNSNPTYINEALSSNNPSPYTRAIWTVASRLADESSYQKGGGVIRDGGVDFSDFVEVLWVFDLADSSDGLHDVRGYWDQYVLNESATGTPRPPVEPIQPPVEPPQPPVEPPQPPVEPPQPPVEPPQPPVEPPQPPVEPPQPPEETPTAIGLVAHWTLDEGEGQSISDSSGNNNDGSLINGSWNDSGASGGSLSFQGGNEGMEIPASAFDTVRNEITISMWINGASNQPVADSVFTATDSNGYRVLNIHVPWSDSKVYWDAGSSGNSYDRVSQKADAELYMGGWNHWAFTKDADSGVMSIYVNGKLFTSATGKSNDISGITTVVLGGNESVAYSGGMDEVRLYDEALSASEIFSLYQEVVLEQPQPPQEGDGDLGVQFAATEYDVESNPGVENLVRDMGTKVGYIKEGTWIGFDDFDLSSGASSIEFSASSDREGGTIELRTGSATGPLIASVDVSATGGWFNFEAFQGNLKTPVSGVQDLFLVFVGDSGTWLFDIESFEIN